jgi:hypothetical protein
MDTLRQRYFLATKTFQLLDNKVTVNEKSLFQDKEWEARYDDLGLDIVKIKTREGIGNTVLFGGLLIVSSLMTYNAFTDGKTDYKLAWLFLFFCFMWGTVLSWTIQKYFTAHYFLTGGNKTLEFFIDSPDNKQVLAFIDQIRERTKSKIKIDYTTFDPDLTFDDQLKNLKYLKANDIITVDEFEIIREELRGQHLIKK